jgi:diphthine synthase
MTLALVGTGICFDLTLSAMDALRSADLIYIETYTNLIEGGKISRLEILLGKKVEVVPREKVEGSFLVEKAKESEVCLLSSGDPLSATTHISLMMDCMEKGINTKVIHNSSVYSVAAGASGLQIYRFGKTASLVNPREGYNPTSSLDVIRKNLECNMHSLILLDTEPEPMDSKAALGMLYEFESAVILSRLGEADQKVTFGKISDLLEKDLGRAPFSIIIPAKLHPMEEEYLELL